MRFDGVEAQVQQVRDFFIALAFGHQLQHLAFPRLVSSS